MPDCERPRSGRHADRFSLRYLSLGEKERIEEFNRRVAELDLESLARDVEPFLFSPEQKERVLTFRKYWQQHQ